MVRLRPPQPADGPPELPPELATCWVEDWEDKRPPPAHVGHNPEDVNMWRLVTARVRWRRARGEWAEQHGIDQRKLPSGGAPRWRARAG